MPTPSENQEHERGDTELLVEYLDEQINSHQANIRVFKIWSLALALLGVLLTALCFALESGLNKLPDLMKIGPTLVMAPISSYQYSTVLASRKIITCYRFWKKSLGKCIAAGVEPPKWIVDAVINNMNEVGKK